MKRFKILLLLLTSLTFFSLADSESQTTTGIKNKEIQPFVKPNINVDSIVIYAKIIDSNHAFTEARIRNFVNKVLARSTRTDTLKSKISIR